MNSSLGNNIAGIGTEERREEKLHNPVTKNGTGHAHGKQQQTSEDNSQIESGPQDQNCDEKIEFKGSELQEEGAVGVIAAERSVVIPAGRVKFTAMRIQATGWLTSSYWWVMYIYLKDVTNIAQVKHASQFLILLDKM